MSEELLVRRDAGIVTLVLNRPEKLNAMTKPLWRLLGGRSSTIKVYASGINPGGAAQTAEAALTRGHVALKLKVGFGVTADELTRHHFTVAEITRPEPFSHHADLDVRVRKGKPTRREADLINP